MPPVNPLTRRNTAWVNPYERKRVNPVLQRFGFRRIWGHLLWTLGRFPRDSTTPLTHCVVPFDPIGGSAPALPFKAKRIVNVRDTGANIPQPPIKRIVKRPAFLL